MNPTCRAGSGVALVVVLTLVDSACYMLIERRSFLDARAMTVISIATVGYEEVKPLDTAGRLFTTAAIGFSIVVAIFGALSVHQTWAARRDAACAQM